MFLELDQHARQIVFSEPLRRIGDGFHNRVSFLIYVCGVGLACDYLNARASGSNPTRVIAVVLV